MKARRVRGPALILCALAIGGATVAQSATLRLVSTAWPPFTNTSGQVRFALDLVESAFGRIGVSSTTTVVEAAQFTPSLLTGPFDGSAAAWRDPAREKVLLFSRPYLENRLILVGRRGADVSAVQLKSLAQKRIAIVEGYSYGDIENAGPVFVRSRSEEDSLRLLLDSKVDYMLMDDLVVQYIVANHAEEARTRLAIGAAPLVRRPLHLAIRRTVPDAKSIIERFNAQLRTMIADRTYHRLLHVDWIEADVDGDGIDEYVAGSDQSGPNAPERAYSLFSPPQPKPQTATPQRYFFGGSVYTGWETVPERYKTFDAQRPDPKKAAYRVYTFSWK